MTEDECTRFIEKAKQEWAELDAQGRARLHLERRSGESDGSYAMRLIGLLYHERHQRG